VDARGEETPFLFAVKWSHFESARALLEAGADVNFQDGLGKTALHYMLKKRSDPKYVRMLLEHGARLDLEDHDGMTAGSMLSRMRSPEYQKLAKKRSSPI
jgi:ankyrin repeat protein